MKNTKLDVSFVNELTTEEKNNFNGGTTIPTEAIIAAVNAYLEMIAAIDSIGQVPNCQH